MKGHILFINPNPRLEDQFGIFKKLSNVIPPLGVAYIGAVLEKNGFTCSFIDGGIVKDWIKKIGCQLKQKDVLAVYITSTSMAFGMAIRAAKAIKAIDKRIPVVVGGAHISELPNDLLSCEEIDYGVVGEGEMPGLQIANALAKGDRELKGISGLVWRNNGGVIVEPLACLTSLDDLPLPAWHLFSGWRNYSHSPIHVKRQPSAHLVTSRYCPMGCKFCTTEVSRKSYRAMSPERVIDQLKAMQRQFCIKDVRFFDDSFTLNKKRTIAICDTMLKEGIDISWACLTRVDCVDKELLTLMKKAGCWQILIGPQSGDERILKEMKTGFSKNDVYSAVETAHSVGLSIRADYIIGYPGETVDSIEATYKFACELNTDLAEFNIFVPYPGTPVYFEIKDKGELIHEDYTKYTTVATSRKDFRPYTPPGISSEQLISYFFKFHKQYYLRPRYISSILVSSIRNGFIQNLIKCAPLLFATFKKN